MFGNLNVFPDILEMPGEDYFFQSKDNKTTDEKLQQI